MRHDIKTSRLWIWIPIALALLAVSGFAVQRSVEVRASWKVLPYQTLQLNNSRDESSVVAFELPEATSLDRARGYIESEHAVRLHVVSNTPWKVQVWVRSAQGEAFTSLQVRRHGGTYLDLSSQPQILAQGQNGVFEISVDYRISIGADGVVASQTPQEVVYTIMSD